MTTVTQTIDVPGSSSRHPRRGVATRARVEDSRVQAPRCWQGGQWGLQENPEAFDDFQRKCRTHFNPPITTITFYRLPRALRDDSVGHVALVRVGKSEHVDSVIDGGTWSRGDASNRQLGAKEITDLSYRRGERSAESETVAVPMGLLETPTWHSFVSSRNMRAGSIFGSNECVARNRGSDCLFIFRRAGK